MTAREEVLARIRAALGSGTAGTAPWPDGEVPRGYRTGAGPGTPALIGLLTERLRDYGTPVRRCAPDGVTAAVSQTLAGRGTATSTCPASRAPR